LGAEGMEVHMAYLSKEERRQRIRELVQEKTGVDCPTLVVEQIEESMGPVVRVFYWCNEEDRDKNEHLQHIRLDNEEAESIGVSRAARRPNRDMNQ
jgi:hypothetical protein